MARFKNPNDPPQPQSGVYGWFLDCDDGDICLYIGEAGKRKGATQRGTLYRGASELQGATFSSDKHYRQLDTDFVVGAAIRHFEAHGHSIYWEHLSDNPAEENNWVRRLEPILQHSHKPHIYGELKIPESEAGYWRLSRADPAGSRRKISEAETRVGSALAEIFPRVNSRLVDTGLKRKGRAATAAKREAFALSAESWYAWQMIPGYVGEHSVPYCSPIWVTGVTPSKTGDGTIRLRFDNVLYARGVQDFDVDMRILKREDNYLIAEFDRNRSAVISRIEFEWIEQFCPALWRQHPASPSLEGSRGDVSQYLREIFNRPIR